MFAPYRGVCAFPVCTARAPDCSTWSGPCVECGSSFRVLHKSAGSVVPAFCVFPGLSGSGSQRLARTLPRNGVPFPSAAVVRGQPEGWVASPRVRRAFSLRGPSARRRLGLRKSLDRTWGPVCRVGGGGFSGAEFAPFSSPLPPSSSGDGAALLWSFSVPSFCKPPAVCYRRLIFPCSPTV